MYILYLQNAQSEAVTFLGSSERGQSLYTIPGLDYVSQNDIMPYTTAEKIPIHHELFDKFLTYDPSSSECGCHKSVSYCICFHFNGLLF